MMIETTLDEAIVKCNSPSELCKVLGYDEYAVMERVHNPKISLTIEQAKKLGIIDNA